MDPEDLPLVQASEGATDGAGKRYVNENVAPWTAPDAVV